MRSNVLAAMVLFAATPATAQELREPPADARQRSASIATARLEDSYILFSHQLRINDQLDPLIFEAMIAPHFRLALPWLNGVVVASPIVTLRMYDTESFPVRTPSYAPRLTAFVWPRSVRDPGAALLYASFAVAHYSNGQEGPLLDSTGALNHRNGSFATNYVEIGVHRGRTIGRGFAAQSAVLQINPAGALDPPIRDRYGRNRLRFQAEWVFRMPGAGGVWRAQLNPAILIGPVDTLFRSGLERVQWSASLAVRPRPLGQLGVIVHHYWGQDYYNIWLDRRIHALRVGLVGSLMPELPAALR